MASEAVEIFRQQGCLNLQPLTPEQVDETLAWLKTREVFSGRHVVQADTTGFSTWQQAASANVLCWRMGDAVLAPHLLARALEQINFASEYLEVETPLLYSMNVFCTRPGQPVRPDIQDWHRDSDDKKFLPMFFYLTDVGMDAGQELRVHKTHTTLIVGPRGKTFFSDTMREHRGLKPQHAERIIAWARWGVSNPPASYQWDKLQPIDASLLGDRYPSEERLRKAINLIAR
jgi:hypothetical protein